TDLQSAKKFGVLDEIDISRWKLFQISDLFNVQKGKRLTKADMKDGKIRFIGASAINNGITAYISNDVHLHPQNTITLSYNGSIGEAFYQDEMFWASDDVNVLYPKFEMNREIAFFIIPLLKMAGKRYAFIDKWKKEDMEKSKILLPADIDGNPDYKYMEKYIATELSITENTLNKLTMCV
ncbi:MAG: restriction endonuclease subunit S, partial [Oscillospiraceae bacterium]|nr:restriction endonuclease subunit S [Oscillospiraceae bacterium]